MVRKKKLEEYEERIKQAMAVLAEFQRTRRLREILGGRLKTP